MAAPRTTLLRRALVGLAVVLVLTASGCEVVLTTGIEARTDGSGAVRAALGLDDGALRELGDPTVELRLDDLRESGWTVAGPAREPDGLTWVRLSKPFSSPGEASDVAGELSGADGPFREFRVERRRSLLKTRTGFTGVVDLTQGLAGLSDPSVAEKLGEVSPGLDVEGLRARFGDAAGGAVRVRVEARLPGDVSSNGSTGRDGVVVWEPRLGEELRLTATAEALNVRPVVAALAALVFAAGALVVVARRR